MNKNDKGFSLIEILIVIIAISLISAVGWKVYNRQKSQDTATPQQTTETINLDTDVNDEITPGYKTYSKNGISFEYPEDWTMNEFGQGLTSPDFISETDNRHGSSNILSGAWISIQYPTLSKYPTYTIENYRDWIDIIFSGYKGNELIMTINNKRVIQFPSSYRHDEIDDFGFDGQETIYLATDSSPASIGLAYKIDDDKNKYDGIYQHLLKTLNYN